MSDFIVYTAEGTGIIEGVGKSEKGIIAHFPLKQWTQGKKLELQ